MRTWSRSGTLRDIAYDVVLEHGPVVEIHVLSRSSFEDRRRNDHPFVRRVLREGESRGRFLNDLSTLRKQADYGYDAVDEDL